MTLASIAALDVLIWPSYRDALQNLDLPSALQALIGSSLSIATPAGFLSAEFFSWTPVLLIVYAIIQGTGAIGGEDGAGRWSCCLRSRYRGMRVVLEKTAVDDRGRDRHPGDQLSGLRVHGAVRRDRCADVRRERCGREHAADYAAVLRARAVAGGTAAGARDGHGALDRLVTAAWVANTLAQGVSSMRGPQYVTPFHYYGAGLPLVDGIAWGHVALLLALAAAVPRARAHAAERRDVGAGGGDIDVLGAVRRRVGAARRCPGAILPPVRRDV